MLQMAENRQSPLFVASGEIACVHYGYVESVRTESLSHSSFEAIHCHGSTRSYGITGKTNTRSWEAVVTPSELKTLPPQMLMASPGVMLSSPFPFARVIVN